MFNSPQIQTDKFSKAGKIAKIGIFEYDIAKDLLSWSNGVHEIVEADQGFIPNRENTFSLFQDARSKAIIRNAFNGALTSGEMINVDVEIRTLKGNTKHIWCIAEVDFKDGNPNKIYGIAQDITERKGLEKDLQIQNQQLRFAEKTVAIGYWKWTLPTDEVTWSKNLYSIFEVAPGTPLKFNDAIAKVHPEDLAHVEHCTNNILNTGVFNKFSYRIVLETGVIKHIELQGQTTIDSNNTIVEIIGTAQDITEQIQKEKQLKQKNYQLRKAEKMASIGHWTWNLEEDIALWSDNLYDIYEVEKNTVITLDKFTSFIVDTDKEKVAKNIETAIKTKIFNDIVYQIQLPNGKTKTIKTVGEVKVIENNRVVEMIGTCQDITEQEKKEQLLIQKNHQLNLAEEMAIVGHWSWFPETNSVTWSKNLYKIYGHEKDATISYDTYIGYVYQDDKKYVSDKIRKAFETGIFDNQIYRIQLRNGAIKTIKSVGKVIHNKEGKVIEMLGTCQDITEQVGQQQELIRKNNHLNIAEKLAKIGYYQWNTVTHEIIWSDNLYEIFEHEKGAPITFETYYNYIHEGDRDYVQRQVEAAYAGKKHHDVFHRIQLQNGSVKNIHLVAVGQYNEKNELIEVIGTLQDVTEQEEKTQQLIRNNHLLNTAEQLNNLGHWRLKPNENNEGEWSDNHYRIFGAPIGKKMTFEDVMEYVLPEDHKILLDAYQEIFNSKRFPKHTYKIKTPEGQIKIIEAKGEVILDAKNEITEVLGTVKDISTEHEAEIRFRDLFAATPDAILIANEDGEIQLVNKQAEQFFGYTAQELKEFIVVNLVAKGYRNKSVAYYEAFFKNPKNLTLTDFDDLHLVHKDGRRIPATVTLGPFKVNNQTLAIIALKDITILKQQEEELLLANAELKESSEKLRIQNRQLEDFTHITSHNLRSPVNNLKTLINFYKETPDQESKDLIFEKLETVSHHLNETLNTLIESLMIKNETNPEKEQLNLDVVLRKTTELLAAQIKEKDVEIISDFSEKQVVCYHKIYLESIFLNLISNSIKYSCPSRKPKVTIKSYIKENKVHLQFTDNGLGIDLKKHGHKVFGLHKVFHRNPEARGIGLFMTKAQIEAMGGTIDVESEVDKGTTFIINLNNGTDA